MTTADFLIRAAINFAGIYGDGDDSRQAWADAQRLLDAAPKLVRDELAKDDAFDATRKAAVKAAAEGVPEMIDLQKRLVDDHTQGNDWKDPERREWDRDDPERQ